MIENHLLILVNNVKKQTLVSFLCVLLVGCDNATVLVSFTPEMASFSNEFDFDPLRGPVKDFSQTLMNDKGEVTKRISGTLSQEGCFDTLELHDLENNTGLALVLDANYYRDAETMEKRVRLQGKCQLAELPSAGVVWDTDDRPLGNVKQTCEYDNYANPTNCQLVIVDESVEPAVARSYTIKNTIDYYPATSDTAG